MKRRALKRHLREQGARRIDEGGNHARRNGPTGKPSAAPRQPEIDFALARATCMQLAVPLPIGPR